MKKYNLRPTGLAAPLETNATNKASQGGNVDEYVQHYRHRIGHGSRLGDRCRRHGGGGGQGRGLKHGYTKAYDAHQKSHDFKGSAKPKVHTNLTWSYQKKNICCRWGMTNHWSRMCRTAKHLVELYHASKKDQGKIVEQISQQMMVGIPPTLKLDDFDYIVDEVKMMILS